jgi:hypothetical protein
VLDRQAVEPEAYTPGLAEAYKPEPDVRAAVYRLAQAAACRPEPDVQAEEYKPARDAYVPGSVGS